jgi:hypothetical protein
MHDAAPALFGMGLLMVIMVFALIMTIISIFLWWKIFSKAGYSGALALLMLIPLVNIIMIFFLALAEWPIQKELAQLKSRVNRPPINP